MHKELWTNAHLILIVIVSQSTLFYALLGPSQYSSPSPPGFRHPLAPRPPLLWAIIQRGGNPSDLNAGLGALA